MTGTVPQPGDLDDHHIVPKASGKEQETRTSIDSILNRPPLSSATNRNAIRDRLPNQYLPELIEANGSDAVRATLRTHYISDEAFDILLRDPFGPEDYEAFTVQRHQSIIRAIESLLVKERFDLAPVLQELDARIEGVELALRHLVDRRLGSEAELLPSAVNEKIDQRLAIATRRNPAAAGAGDRLTSRLEYADLRELEVAITNKLLWPRFEDVFVVKQQFSHRLDQLAELRNGIRHSRSVTEVVRKDGEAALHWFEPLLAD